MKWMKNNEYLEKLYIIVRYTFIWHLANYTKVFERKIISGCEYISYYKRNFILLFIILITELQVYIKNIVNAECNS